MNTSKKRASPGPQNRDSSGRFIKGVSGNPGGKKWLPDELKVKARAMSQEGLVKIGQLLKRETTTDRDLIAAVRLLLEYGYGRPAAELDRERLDLDRKRLDIEQQRADVATTTGPSMVTVEWNGAEELAE